MEIGIRSYHPSDLLALCRICLLTGANGQDASGLYRDPDLLGLYYVAPYVALEPALCFVLTRHHEPCGYVLGTQASAAFSAWCERDWFPVLRQRFALPDEADTSPDAWIVRMIHRGQGVADDLSLYPAHLHIDIMPLAQGQGWGRRLIGVFIQRLQALGVTGVHLGVGKANRGAIAFYERVGFELIQDVGEALIYGQRW